MYAFAVQLGIKHKFNCRTEKAGYDWFHSFLSRNPEITIRKSEGVSIARSAAMNKDEVHTYFTMLEKIMEEHDLFNKPGSVFNMDESGLQLNNRPSHVLAEKGSRAVTTLTSTEKGETITIIACCNAEGHFLPPACIFKGKYKKKEFQDGMPLLLFSCRKSWHISQVPYFLIG